MPDFHETIGGRTFYEQDVPKIIDTLSRIQIELSRANDLKEQEIKLQQKALYETK